MTVSGLFTKRMYLALNHNGEKHDVLEKSVFYGV